MKKSVFNSVMIICCLFLTANITSAWISPVRLTWNSGSSYAPKIMSDPSGILHLCWYDDSSGVEEIYYKQSTDGGSNWSAVKRLTWVTGSSLLPDITVDPVGGVYVVWQDDTPGNYDIFYKYSSDGGPNWSAPKRVTWTSNFSMSPIVVVDSANYVHVFWSEEISSNYELCYKASFDYGNTWTYTQRLTWNSGDSNRCAAEMNGTLNIYLVWDDATPGTNQIFFKSSTNGGTLWSPPKRMTWTSGYSYSPSIEYDKNNILHLVWFEYMNSNYEVLYKNSTDQGATWSATKRMTWNSGLSEKAKVISDSNGNVHIIWTDDTPGQYEIYYKSSTDQGSTWSAPVRLTWNSGSSNNPHFTQSTANNIHVVWDDQTTGNREIMYKRKY